MQYSQTDVEAAMLLHEAMLDARLDNSLPAVAAAFDRNGPQGMRLHALALAPFVGAVTDALGDARDGYSYAYEVVPAILAVIEWDGAGYTLPAVDAAARDVAAALAAL